MSGEPPTGSSPRPPAGNGPAVRESVDADVAAIAKAGARIGTPSFFINGKLLQGAQPYPAFKAAVDEALK